MPNHGLATSCAIGIALVLTGFARQTARAPGVEQPSATVSFPSEFWSRPQKRPPSKNQNPSTGRPQAALF
jgi:uncharacterized membrane protein